MIAKRPRYVFNAFLLDLFAILTTLVYSLSRLFSFLTPFFRENVQNVSLEPIKVLRHIFEGWEPETKLLYLFLLKLSAPFAEDQKRHTIGIPGEKLASMAGFSKKKCFEALRTMSEAGFIEELPVQGRIGRPRKVRRISTERLLVIQPVLTSGIPSWVIDQMLSDRLNEKTQRPLSNAEFLLILVLAANANSAGICIGLSQLDISKLTGIPKQQVPRRVRQLTEKNLIAAVVPGTAEKTLTGIVSSTYYLDLASPLFRQAGTRTTSLCIPRTSGISEIDRLKNAVAASPPYNPNLRVMSSQWSSGLMKQSSISTHDWRRFFDETIRRLDVSRFLQAGIERYAAYLIHQPNKIMPAIQWRRISPLASSEFMNLMLGRTEQSHKLKEPEVLGAMADLEELAHNLASLCLKHLNKKSDFDNKNCHHRILPSHEESEFVLHIQQISFERNGRL